MAAVEAAPPGTRRSAEIGERVRTHGFRVDAREPREFALFLDAEIERWARIIAAAPASKAIERTTIARPSTRGGAMTRPYTRYSSLADKLVFISGGSSGIGAELVHAFAAQGARVAFCGTRPDGGAPVIAAVRAAGHAAPRYACVDVRDTAAYQAALAQLCADAGPVQVLINNAGRDDRHRMEDVTPEFWDDRLALNLKHYFFAIQAVAPGMASAGGGVVVNLGSVSWMRGRPDLVGYTTAKAGILGLTRTLARELGGRNIRVNALVPGAIVTERQNSLHRDAAADQDFLAAQCLKIRLDPTHVARAALFLASDDADGMTGQHVLVDAGIAQQSVIT